MAIKWMTLTCDYCDKQEDEYEDEYEAAEHGWYFLTKPGLDGFDEKCYCCHDCFLTDNL